MRRNKVYLGIILLLLSVIVVWAFYGMFHTGKAGKVYDVSVIVENSNNDRWIALKEGLTQAASDYDIKLNFVSAGEFRTAEEELAMINREIDNGAEGIIVQMVSSTVQEKALEEISSRAAVMLLETDVAPENIYALAGADNAALGAALAEAVKADLGTAIAGKTIGILCGNQNQIAMQQRLHGFTEEIRGSGTEVVWTKSSAEVESSADGALENEMSADIVVALENDETEYMVDMLSESSNMFLYGIGCSEKIVYYLDKGVIRTMVVPNEFHMGYQSMEALANQLRYHLEKAEDCETEYLIVNRENLYETDNQKVLFPIVQ